MKSSLTQVTGHMVIPVHASTEEACTQTAARLIKPTKDKINHAHVETPSKFRPCDIFRSEALSTHKHLKRDTRKEHAAQLSSIYSVCFILIL